VMVRERLIVEFLLFNHETYETHEKYF
jgi:hypothetical protein